MLSLPTITREESLPNTVKPGVQTGPYRPDIDGIRGIAISSVVLYHAGAPLLTGGFTGVDIFFVISGYLIGGHIFSEAVSGTFSYLRFYQRRAKRILPAFLAVLAFVILAALILMSPLQAAEVGRSAFAATLSASNILFWRTSSYFAPSSELNPLLMTWSLGVEEQFYIFIPLLIVILIRTKKSWLLPAILAACVVSFLYASIRIDINPMFAFYMLPTRAWELGVGVALAVAELRRNHNPLPPRLRQAIAASGILLMLAPMAVLTKNSLFPGAAALPSVFGTAAVLAVPSSWVNCRVLSQPPLVFIGKVSYSWYLWHWPLLAFAHLLHDSVSDGGKLPLTAGLLAIAIAFGAAVLSYIFVEQPLRKSTVAPGPLLARYAIASAAMLAVCAIVWLSNGLPNRYPSLANLESANPRLANDPCLVVKAKPNLLPPCYDPYEVRPSVALWGDSHSAALAPGLRFHAKTEDYSFVQLSKASCLPLSGAEHYIPASPLLASDCLRFNNDVLGLLATDRRIRIVILAANWADAFRQTAARGWMINNLAQHNKMPSADDAREIFKQSLTASILSLQRAGKKVVIMQDVPTFDFNPVLRVEAAQIPARRLLASLLTAKYPTDPGLAPIGDVSDDDASGSAIKQTIAGLSGVKLVDTRNTLCDSRNLCLYRDGNHLLYTDYNHVSTDGALYALRGFTFPAP